VVKEESGHRPYWVDPNRRRKEKTMKRIRLLVLLTALAVALPVGVLSGIAKATGGTTDQVSINQYADYDLPSLLQVGLQVRCYGGDGVASVQVDQSPPETASPTTFGASGQPVVCDGKTHSVGVSIVGVGYDTGKALATATLVVPTTAKTTVVTRQIVIREV
jgi:hypothetical protein